jgi:hypothetical protein
MNRNSLHRPVRGVSVGGVSRSAGTTSPIVTGVAVYVVFVVFVESTVFVVF